MPLSEHTRESKIGIVLFGGLGNQLFQFAAALSLTVTNKFDFYFDLLGKTNNDPDGFPEIFMLGKISDIGVRKRGSIVRAVGHKLSKVSLMLSSVNTDSLFKLLVKKFLSVITRSLFLAVFRTSIDYPTGVGYDPHFAESVSKNSTIIGNFHSYKWISLESKARIIDEFSNTNFSVTVSQFRERAKDTKPIAVHIRLGDYESIEELNVVNKEYFNSALDMLTKDTPNQEIWIFTNDKEKSAHFIGAHFQSKAIWIPDNLNSLETLEVMRHCHSFIISNSTFSWWAAFLAKESKPLVIAPKVWIKNHPEPLEICPPHWQRM